MSDIGTAVSLLVATVELAQVRSIRNAIRANLIAAGGVEGPLGTITMPKPVGPTREQPREIEHARRLIVQPEPRVLPRQVITPDPIVESAPIVPDPNASDGSHLNNPLVPPWKMPLPAPHDGCVIIVKQPPPPPDLINKGSLVDLYV